MVQRSLYVVRRAYPPAILNRRDSCLIAWVPQALFCLGTSGFVASQRSEGNVERSRAARLALLIRNVAKEAAQPGKGIRIRV